MDKTFIFGHKNPDTDSICSAMALANLRSKLGEEVEATRLGELNKETEYAFKTFNIKAPRLLEKVEPGTNVIMVDHNEFSQSVDGIENANIKMLVDHHKISNFETKIFLDKRFQKHIALHGDKKSAPIFGCARKFNRRNAPHD